MDAPTLLTWDSATSALTCVGTKISSCSGNGPGNVAHCTFPTDKLFPSSCVPSECDTYHPSDGFLYLLCGDAVTNLGGIVGIVGRQLRV